MGQDFDRAVDLDDTTSTRRRREELAAVKTQL